MHCQLLSTSNIVRHSHTCIPQFYKIMESAKFVIRLYRRKTKIKNNKNET